MSASASRARGRATRVAALLLYALTALGVPALHALGENEHHASAPQSAFAFTAGCPEDCREPGHHHRAHDHATCAACQGAHRAADRALRIGVVRPSTSLAPSSQLEAPRFASLQSAPTSLRGPPTTLAS